MGFRWTANVGDVLHVGDATIHIDKAHRGEARIRVDAPRHVRISRVADVATEHCSGTADLPPGVIDELRRLDHAELVPCRCRKAFVKPGAFCPQCIGDSHDLIPMRAHGACDDSSDIPF